MPVYVDDVRLPFGRMVMCHMWASREIDGRYEMALDDLLGMVDAIGVPRKWMQQPPKASWVHFDISLAKKALAIEKGAILMDRLACFEHVARLAGNAKGLEAVENSRKLRGLPLDGRVSA